MHLPSNHSSFIAPLSTKYESYHDKPSSSRKLALAVEATKREIRFTWKDGQDGKMSIWHEIGWGGKVRLGGLHGLRFLIGGGLWLRISINY